MRPDEGTARVDDVEERSRLDRALHEIDVRIHSNLEPRQILQSALDGLVDALHVDAGDIKILEGDHWVVRYQAGFTPDLVGLRLSIDEAPVANEVAVSRHPVLIEDYLDQARVPYVGFPFINQLRSTIAVPLVVRGEVTGCLFGWMKAEPRTFTANELSFARSMASSVALALESARLLEAEQEARKRAETAEGRLEQELEVTKILLRASDELSATTETDELLERLARVVREATGISRAFINLIDTASQVLIPKVATGGLTVPSGSNIPFSELSRTSRSAIAEQRTALLDYEHPDVPEYDRGIARANQARLVLFVPLIHRSEIIGHISMDEPGRRHDFSAKQIRVVESISAQAAVALQNARQYEREHHIAETLQQALLEPPEQIDDIEVAVVYQAASATARVGGDFYDVFNLDGDHVAFIVGDVAGKGIRAAPLTALLRDGARAYLLESSDPATCLLRLNTLVHRFTPTDKFATAFIGILHRLTGAMTYCNASHPAPVVLRKDGAHILECRPTQLLGAFSEAAFESQSATLGPGEVLIVVTDGVTEARRDGALFGEEGLLHASERLRGVPVGSLPAALLAEVVEYAGNELRDDVVVLCLGLPVELEDS